MRKVKKVQLPVRLPPDMHAYLKKIAARRGVSLNAEVCTRLDKSRAIDLWELQHPERKP